MLGKVLLALFLMLWPSVLSAAFEVGTWEEVCAPHELEDVRPKLDIQDKPEICIKKRCDDAFMFYATRNVLPSPECLENYCIWFFEPPSGVFGSPLNSLKAYIAEEERKRWLEACTPYWENRPTDPNQP